MSDNQKNNQSKTPAAGKNYFLNAVIVAFALGVFAGGGFMALITPAQTEKSASIEGNENFRFIRPGATTGENGEHGVSKELHPFRYKISALIDDKIRRNQVSAVSVYFRDLNNGTWFGIGEKEKFSPKSLLKLPLMIAYFKWAVSNPLVLRKKLTYTASLTGEGEAAGPGTGLEPGRQYTVNDLIFRMITEDDNQACSLLFAGIPAKRIDKVFKDLNVEYDPRSNDDSLSLRAFASFYRILYNAAYLSEEMSEKALRYLSRSSLKHSVATAVPVTVDVAGKYGERKIATIGEGKELEREQVYELAIVYHPRRPFLIGIVAQGDDRNLLSKALHDIAVLVYEEVDQQS